MCALFMYFGETGKIIGGVHPDFCFNKGDKSFVYDGIRLKNY